MPTIIIMPVKQSPSDTVEVAGGGKIIVSDPPDFSVKIRGWVQDTRESKRKAIEDQNVAKELELREQKRIREQIEDAFKLMIASGLRTQLRRPPRCIEKNRDYVVCAKYYIGTKSSILVAGWDDDIIAFTLTTLERKWLVWKPKNSLSFDSFDLVVKAAIEFIVNGE
jgi:hypothetical protein